MERMSALAHPLRDLTAQSARHGLATVGVCSWGNLAHPSRSLFKAAKQVRLHALELFSALAGER